MAGNLFVMNINCMTIGRQGENGTRIYIFATVMCHSESCNQK